MRTPAAHPLLALAGRSIAELRQLARGTRLRSIYSRLSRSQLVAALQQVLGEAGAAAPAAAPEPQEAATSALPLMAAAGDTPAVSQVTFVPRDPYWATVFWEVSSAERQRAAEAGGQQLCLRLADVTGLQPGVSHPHALQEVVVDAGCNEWFLPVPLCDRDYRVELGYRLAAGGWLHLAFSAVARMPSDGPGNAGSDLYVPFQLEVLPAVLAGMAPGGTSAGVEHELRYRQATAASPRRLRLGSEEFQEQADAKGLADHDLGSASGAGVWASGLTESGSGLAEPRSFWLVADAELIVYGATEPSASLFIGDAQVPLAADGTFGVHVPFRDGRQVYPIQAVAADGEQQRSIRLEFERLTPQAQVNRKEEAVLEWF